MEEVSYLPFYGIDSSGDFVGIVPDILKAFGKKSGIDFEFKPYPILRLSDNYQAGLLDFRYPDNPDWNSPDCELIYSAPVMVVLDGIIVRNENAGRSIISYKRIGTIRGYTAPSLEVYLKYGDLRLIEVDTYESLVAMIVSGRLEAAYLSLAPAFYTAEEKGFKNLITFDRNLPFDEADHCLSTFEHEDVIDRLDSFLKEERGLIEEIYRSWNVDPPENPDINS